MQLLCLTLVQVNPTQPLSIEKIIELHMDGLNMLRSLTDMDQKAYPERLGRLYIVNSPYVFVKVYSMIKKWLDPGGKIRFGSI